MWGDHTLLGTQQADLRERLSAGTQRGARAHTVHRSHRGTHATSHRRTAAPDADAGTLGHRGALEPDGGARSEVWAGHGWTVQVDGLL